MLTAAQAVAGVQVGQTWRDRCVQKGIQVRHCSNEHVKKTKQAVARGVANWGAGRAGRQGRRRKRALPESDNWHIAGGKCKYAAARQWLVCRWDRPDRVRGGLGADGVPSDLDSMMCWTNCR